MKRLVLLIIFLTMTFVSGVCEEGQIDINSASVEKLDDLYGIGPAYAENIINARLFDSVDDLIRVSGIGDITLEKIKTQGLACVQGESVEEAYEEITEIQEAKEEPIEKIIEKKEIQEFSKESEIYVPETIKLEAKSIKSEGVIDEQDNKNFIKYGFVVFCVLLGILFNIRKNKYKNGFD